MNKTDKLRYKERLDNLIAAKKAYYQAVEDFEIMYKLEIIGITSYSAKEIHTLRGIEKLAEAVECELTRHEFDSEVDELFFEYSGFKIFQYIRKGKEIYEK